MVTKTDRWMEINRKRQTLRDRTETELETKKVRQRLRDRD